MKAMIFAAGLGTRLKPLTDTLPKALIPVCGKPLIEHACRKLLDAGIDDVVVNVHHFADKVEHWLDSQEWINTGTDGSKTMRVQISDERKQLLETGGAVLHAGEYLKGCGSFLIHNVDILSDLDLQWFISQAVEGSLATLLVSPRKSARRLLFDPDSMRLMGWYNSQTGEVRSPYQDLNPDDCVSLAFSGIHMMSEKVLEVMEDYARSRGLYLSTDSPRFPVMDFYLWACAYYHIHGVQIENLKLIDVGKLDTLGAAEEFISR